jgi:hypothetical protein
MVQAEAGRRQVGRVTAAHYTRCIRCRRLLRIAAANRANKYISDGAHLLCVTRAYPHWHWLCGLGAPIHTRKSHEIWVVRGFSCTGAPRLPTPALPSRHPSSHTSWSGAALPGQGGAPYWTNDLGQGGQVCSASPGTTDDGMAPPTLDEPCRPSASAPSRIPEAPAGGKATPCSAGSPWGWPGGGRAGPLWGARASVRRRPATTARAPRRCAGLLYAPKPAPHRRAGSASRGYENSRRGRACGG